MSGAVFAGGYAPNNKVMKYTAAGTAWVVIATDGVGYASLAAMATAGKKAWPGFKDTDGDVGMFLQSMTIVAESGAGAAGSGLYVAINKGATFSSLANDAARDDAADFIPAGGTRTYNGPVNNVWIRKVTGADEVSIVGYF